MSDGQRSDRTYMQNNETSSLRLLISVCFFFSYLCFKNGCKRCKVPPSHINCVLIWWNTTGLCSLSCSVCLLLIQQTQFAGHGEVDTYICFYIKG